MLVSPVVATYPLMTLLLSLILFRSAHLSLLAATGVAASVAGIVVLIAG